MYKLANDFLRMAYILDLNMTAMKLIGKLDQYTQEPFYIKYKCNCDTTKANFFLTLRSEIFRIVLY